MSSQQLDEERIFHLARQIPASEARAEYLDQICVDDQALRERVEALLEAHEQESEFLKSGSPESAPTLDHPPSEESPGGQLAGWGLGADASVMLEALVRSIPTIVPAILLIAYGFTRRHS